MQDSYERQCEKEAEHMVFDTAIAAFTETEQIMKASSRTMSIGSSSDLDSFVSATDVSISFASQGTKSTLFLTNVRNHFVRNKVVQGTN